MTDETTARDRAIDDLARRITAQAAISARPGQLLQLEQIADEVRALAGAPTADVAECPTPMHHPLTVCPICHPAAPEGVDAADELTAAQAAIQRVRATVDDWEGVEGTSGFVYDLRRALDGDTAEEKR